MSLSFGFELIAEVVVEGVGDVVGDDVNYFAGLAHELVYFTHFEHEPIG